MPWAPEARGEAESGSDPSLAPQQGVQEHMDSEQLLSDKDIICEACSEAKAASTTVEASTARCASAPAPQRALPFSAWFARQARSNDIVLLTLELVAINWSYLVKVMFKRGRLPVGGSPHAAIQAVCRNVM